MDELDREIAAARAAMPLGGQEALQGLRQENAQLKMHIQWLETLPLHKLSIRVSGYLRRARLLRRRIVAPHRVWRLRRWTASKIYDWTDD